MENKKDFGTIFYLHFFLIVIVLCSPFFVPWFLILSIALVHYIFNVFTKGCFLTKLELGADPDMTFWYYYGSKIFNNLDKKIVKFSVQIILPFVLILVAYFYQQ